MSATAPRPFCAPAAARTATSDAEKSAPAHEPRSLSKVTGANDTRRALYFFRRAKICCTRRACRSPLRKAPRRSWASVFMPWPPCRSSSMPWHRRPSPASMLRSIHQTLLAVAPAPTAQRGSAKIGMGVEVRGGRCHTPTPGASVAWGGPFSCLTCRRHAGFVPGPRRHGLVDGTGHVTPMRREQILAKRRNGKQPAG